VMLMGHLAADPELRHTKSGVSVSNFSVATNRFSYDDGGEKSEVTDFHRIVVWNKLADIVSKYLVKGSAVYIEGKIVNRSFEDKEGKRHFRTEIVAENLNILTWKKSSTGAVDVDIKPVVEDSDDHASKKADSKVKA